MVVNLRQTDKYKLSTYDYRHQPLVGDSALPMIRMNGHMRTWFRILEQYTTYR
jgi:hypothetical protein